MNLTHKENLHFNSLGALKMSDSNMSDVLLSISSQQADTQRFLGRIESSLESIQMQYNQTNENIKVSFDTLNKRISDTNNLLCTSIQEIKLEKENLIRLQNQHNERIALIEKEREQMKGAIYSAKIILGIIGTAVTAIAGFLINVFLKGG